MNLERNVYAGIAAEFTSEEELVAAAKQTYAAGFRRFEALSPIPIEGLAEEIGHRRSGVPYFMLAGGILGALTGYLMQLYALGYWYRLDVGGRPVNSWPLFIPITFELTVLFSAIAGVVSMFWLNDLPKLHHPLFAVPGFERASTNRFFVYVEARDPLFNPRSLRAHFERLDSIQVTEVRNL
ncbi:MAG: DUF3341 domain-containing protein [Verrucomicrobia bacterium]|nr:DUF3341 domain-containing protein [Verrucomicrobiota bacterium]